MGFLVTMILYNTLAITLADKSPQFFVIYVAVPVQCSVMKRL